MTKPDDSRLDPADLRAVEQRASRLLDRTDAWNSYPIPIDDILAVANVQLATTSAFDRSFLLAYIREKAVSTGTRIKSAIDKVWGLYDASERLIHIDGSVVVVKQTFLKLHEIAHDEMPTHRKIFRFFQECNKTLAPEIADQFEREANNFARYVLFKGNTFAAHAADCAPEIKTPITLAKKYGASIYASIREYARTNHKTCVVYALDSLRSTTVDCMQVPVRRIVPSSSFVAQFGHPTDTFITPNHFLWPVLLVGSKIKGPVSVMIRDKNGKPHECVVEAIDTTYNILVLIFTKKSLSTKTIILGSSSASV